MDGFLPGTHRDDKAPKKQKSKRKTKQNKHLDHKLMPLNNFISLPLKRNVREVQIPCLWEAHHSRQLCCPLKEKVPSASGMRPKGWREEKRKEEGSSLTYLNFPFPPFPCAGERDVSYCFWPRGSTKLLCRDKSRGWHASHALR